MSDPVERVRQINETFAGSTLDPEVSSQILWQLPLGLIVVSDALLIQYINQQAAFIFGYAPRALLGKPVSSLLPAELRSRHDEHLRKFFMHPQVRPMNLAQTLSGLHRSGGLVTVKISIGPLQSDEEIFAQAIVERVA